MRTLRHGAFLARETRETRKSLAQYANDNVLGYINIPGRGWYPPLARVSEFIRLVKQANHLRNLLWECTHEWLPVGLERGKVAYDRRLPFYLCKARFRDRKLQQLKNAYDAVLRRLYGLTTRYKWSPVIRSMDFISLHQVHVWDGYSGFALCPGILDIAIHIPDTKPRVLGKDPKHFYRRRPIDEGMHDWENWAIEWLFAEIKEGHIDRFRNCRQCSRWFYAVTDHQSYCSTACRKKYVSASGEFKKKRALYMKQYRTGERQRNERAKDLARKGKTR